MRSLSHKMARLGTFLKGIFLDANGSWRTYTVPIALLIVSILSYGLYASRLGFYWDDWTFAWARFFRGLDGLKDSFFINRPPRAYFEFLLDPILGINPFAWQIFGILTRLSASIALWWFLRQVWPNRHRIVFEVALFSLIYPGFTQQSIAMTYHYFWFFQGIFFFSFGLMAWGLRNKKYLWLALILSWLLSAIQLFSSEYLFGLELLRPLFLWIVLQSQSSDKVKWLKQSVSLSMPYLAIVCIYLYWRIVMFEFPSYQPVLLDQFRNAPLPALASLLNKTIVTIKTVVFDAWIKVVQIPNYTSRFSILYPLVVILSLFGLLIYLNKMPRQTQSDKAPGMQSNADAWQIPFTGMVALLFAGIPFYITNLSVAVTFEFDRLTMPFWFGVGLLLAGLLELLPNKAYTIALVSGMTALAIGAQLYYSVLFRNETDLQEEFAWQLTWRIPALRQGTLILSDDSTFPFTDDEGLSFMLNWIYSPSNYSNQFSLAYITLSSRLGTDIPSLDRNTPVDLDYFSSAHFQGSTNQAIVLYYAPPSCLRILDPITDLNIVFHKISWDSDGQPKRLAVAVLPTLTAEALPLSNLNQIIINAYQAALPPIDLLGEEPSHDWCYYFEKADLARQAEDWDQVAQLGEEAINTNSLRASDLSEYLIFIEADIRLGRLSKAQEFSQQIANWAPSMRPALCTVWQRIENPMTEASIAGVIAAMLGSLNCK